MPKAELNKNNKYFVLISRSTVSFNTREDLTAKHKDGMIME